MIGRVRITSFELVGILKGSFIYAIGMKMKIELCCPYIHMSYNLLLPVLIAQYPQVYHVRVALHFTL